MAELKKSKFTKAAVIKASKQLFYERGYVDTHYNDIVDLSGVNAGSVYYHFKKKNVIAAIILADLLANTKKIVNETFPKCDLQVRIAIETLIGWRLMFTDDKYRRFQYDLSKKRVYSYSVRKIGEWFFDIYNAEYQLGMSENYIKMINLSGFAAEAELIINMEEKYVSFTEEEASEFDIRIVFELLRTDYQRTDEIIQKAREAFSLYDIVMEPYFDIKLTKRQAD